MAGRPASDATAVDCAPGTVTSDATTASVAITVFRRMSESSFRLLSPCCSALAAQYTAQLEGHRLLELVVAARPRVAIGAPALELRRVPEPVPLHVVVGDLY